MMVLEDVARGEEREEGVADVSGGSGYGNLMGFVLFVMVVGVLVAAIGDWK